MNQTPVVNFAPYKRTASCEKSTETLNGWTHSFKSLEEVPLSSICSGLEINLRYSFRTWNYNLEPGMRNMENSCWISLHSKPTHSYGIGLTGLSQANMTDVGSSVSETWDWKLCGLRLCSTLGSERTLTKEGLKDSNTNSDWDEQQDGWYHVVGWRVVGDRKTSVRVTRRVKTVRARRLQHQPLWLERNNWWNVKEALLLRFPDLLECGSITSWGNGRCTKTTKVVKDQTSGHFIAFLFPSVWRMGTCCSHLPSLEAGHEPVAIKRHGVWSKAPAAVDNLSDHEFSTWDLTCDAR